MNDQSPSKPETPKSQSSALHDIALKDLGQTFALSVAVAYVCGFIVVTAYLGKFGLREYAAFRMLPRSFVYMGTFKALAVIAFLLLVDGPYVELAYFYFVALAFLNSYRYQQKSTTEPKALASYFSIASIVLFSGLFGAFFYGHVRPDVGGGSPVTVRIAIDEQRIPPELARVLQLRDGSLASVDLLAETDTELLVGKANSSGRYDELLRVKRELVTAILMHDKRILTPQ